MFPLNGIREHVSYQLDNTIGVLKTNTAPHLSITESNKDNDGHGEHLTNIVIKNLPNSNVWVFDNEFSDRKNNELALQKKNNGTSMPDTVINQSGAFASAGKRVEMTIIYHHHKRLYLIMVEMKRQLSPRKYRKDIIKKYEHSLATLSVFIAAHLHFPALTDTRLYPIGVCCYNYYDDPNPNDDRDPQSIGGKFRANYNRNKRSWTEVVETLSLQRMRIPILCIQNPNDPINESFEIDFNDIIANVSRI